MEDDVSGGARNQRRVKWLPLSAILLAGGVLIGVLQAFELFSNEAHRNLATIAAALLVGGLTTLWAVFGTGLARRNQLLALLAAAAAVAAFVACCRIESVSGNLWPRITWRWTAKPDESLAVDLPHDSDGAQEEVDLTRTGEYDSTQFLGTDRDATVAAPPLASDWSEHPPRRLWRQPIGAGWSSFAVVGDYAVTQEQRGDQELATCYALDTGELLWLHADQGRFSGVMSGDGPRATPTIDEGRLYTLGALGQLNCLDGRTGQRIWGRNVVQENSASIGEWGKSCSPLVVDDVVVVSAGGANGHSLVAYDKQTGEPVWNAGSQSSSYSSPRLAELLEVRQILIVNQGSVAAHAVDDGHILWEFEWPGSDPKVPDAAAIDGDHVLIGAGYGVGCKLLRVERLAQGGLSVEPVWHTRALKPKFTNVVAHEGYIYGLDDGKALVCLDLNDGQRRWRGGRFGHGQILLVNDMLLVQAESGEAALVEASPKGFHELSRFAALDDQTWNVPVVAGRLLLVRNAQEAACYELPLVE